MNLLSNAIKFTPREGSVLVRLIATDSEAQLSVADTGEGIKPEFLPHVFEPFRQQDSSATRVHGGLGLGLAIVRHLVALHDGTIHVDSPGVGRGATFTVRLPLMAGTSDTTREQPGDDADVAESPALSETIEHLHVLVVEDDQDARELVQTVIAAGGAEVTAVASAEEALAVIDRLRPDVLVSDIGLPDQDGYMLIRRLRQRESERRQAHIPAIAVTAWASAADRRRAESAGYHMHVAKPIDASELLRAIALLARAGPQSTDTSAR